MDTTSGDNVILFPGSTTNELPPDRILKAAIDEKVSLVVILGYTPEGKEYFASSTGDKQEIVWLLERLKYELLKDG